MEHAAGTRPFPQTDHELAVVFGREYRQGYRLHPFVYASWSSRDALSVRRWYRRHSPAQGRMLDECLRRQEVLDREGRREVIQHHDLRYRLSVIEGREARSSPPPRNGERRVAFQLPSPSAEENEREPGRVGALHALEMSRARLRLAEELDRMDLDQDAVWQAYENRE